MSFFAVYALGFGNHLMMILLAPAAALYLAARMPGGARGLLTPRVVAAAAGLAALGSLQYPEPELPVLAAHAAASLVDALRTFWFDVTKSDWRATMIVGIDIPYRLRLGMYWFDLRQQFGTAPVFLALAGTAWLAVHRWREALLVVTGYLVAAAFAYTYNVGDAHVFFLPSHLFVALAAGGGLGLAASAAGRLRGTGAHAATALVVLAAVGYPAWRFYDTWPAVDRSGDRRPIELVQQMTRDLDPQQRIMVADLNWQLQNGLDYYTHHLRQDAIQVRGGDRVMTLPWLIHDNLAAGREVIVLPETRRLLQVAYGGWLRMEPENPAWTPPLDARVAALRPGTPYVLALLKPYDDLPFDAAELSRTVRVLTGGTATMDPTGVYTIMTGVTGRPPAVLRADARPYRLLASVEGLGLDLRMESWLPADTMRRAGFGHVIANRRHALTLERGVSFVALGPGGRPVMTAYASGLLAPVPRYRIRPAPGA